MNTIHRLYRRRIGEILVSEGVITSSQLDEALALQKRSGELLGSILLDMKLVTEAEIAKTLCTQYQLPYISLQNYEFDPKLVKLFPPEFLAANRLLPFDKVGDTLLVMIAEVPPEDVLAEIPRLTKLGAGLYVGFLSEIEAELGKLLGVAALGKKKAAAAGEGQPAKRPEDSSKAKRPAERPAAEPERRPAAATAVSDPEVDSLFRLGEEAEQLVAALAASSGDEDEAEFEAEDRAEAEPEAEPEKPGASKAEPVVFGESAESFLKALDSTWDAIFPGSPSEDEESD